MKHIYIAVALVAAAALGYCLHPTSGGTGTWNETEEVVEKRPASAISDEGTAAQIAALRKRVRDLEALLADSQRREETKIAVSNEVVRAMPERLDRPPKGGPDRERLEEFRARDPERFAQMTNRLAKMHQERKSRLKARASFLSSVDTSNLSAKDKETHESYQSLLARKDELDEQMHSPDMSEEDRHELMGEVHKIDRQMRSLGESERQVLLGSVAQAIGVEGDMATELVQTVNDVFDATESNAGPPGPPPPGGMQRRVQN